MDFIIKKFDSMSEMVSYILVKKILSILKLILKVLIHFMVLNLCKIVIFFI